MKITLMVDWYKEEILTTKELDERINERVKEIMHDTDIYDEYLEEYLDFNYTKRELFDILSSSDTEREKVLADIRSGVAEAIHNYVNEDIGGDFHDITIEI